MVPRLVAKAWSDPAFRKRLIADGRAAAIELGLTLPAHRRRLVVLENTRENRARSRMGSWQGVDLAPMRLYQEAFDSRQTNAAAMGACIAHSVNHSAL